jgi:hypothetical protein
MSKINISNSIVKYTLNLDRWINSNNLVAKKSTNPSKHDSNNANNRRKKIEDKL